MEQDLQIYENGQYKNVYLKTRYKRNGRDLVIEGGKKVPEFMGLEDGNHIIVEKVDFAEGNKIEKPTYTMFSCKALYKGQEISFVLYERDHINWASAGGVGDKVKISCIKETIVNKKTGSEMLVDNLVFEPVN